MIKGFLFLLFLPVCAFSQALTSGNEIKDAGFRKFEAQLMKAVAARDTVALEAMLSDEIDNGQMDYYPKEDFWRANDFHLDGYTAWNLLDKTLKFRFYEWGAADSLAYKAPGYQKQIDEGYASGKTVLAITAKDVNVRKKPAKASPIITKISKGIFETKPGEYQPEIYTAADKSEWAAIKLPDGRWGYVSNMYTSRYRPWLLEVKKTKDGFKITGFYIDGTW
jgi:hypothetical protein